MYRIVIVEDEYNAQQALAKMLRLMFSQIQIAGIFPSIEESKTFLEKNRVDIVFLDIELEDGISIDLLKQLTEINFRIIFTTGFNQYTIDAIRLSAVDYLLKPIDPEELKNAVSNAMEQIAEEKQNRRLISSLHKNTLEDEKKLVIKTAENTYLFQISNIIVLEADGAYTKVTCTDKTILTSKHLKYFEGILKSSDFIRTHQSYLVNPIHIKHISKSEMVLSNRVIAKIASRKYADVVHQVSAMQ